MYAKQTSTIEFATEKISINFSPIALSYERIGPKHVGCLLYIVGTFTITTHNTYVVNKVYKEYATIH